MKLVAGRSEAINKTWLNLNIMNIKENMIYQNSYSNGIERDTQITSYSTVL